MTTNRKWHAPLVLAALMAATTLLTSCDKDYDYITNEYNDQQTYVTNIVSNNSREVTLDIRPAYLKEGDTVAVCALSNFTTEDEISTGISTLKSWGLVVVEAPNILKQDGRYAGTLEERVAGLQQMVSNPNIRAIFFTRGGYGASQTLPYIDWQPMLASPKWIIGYSDLTALHITLNNIGVETIHGPMMRGFTKDSESVAALKSALWGEYDNISISTNSNCVTGSAEGRLVGGNLSLIYSEEGTAYELNCKNAILFIEDTGEANYSVDRMLLNLELSGKLDQLKGIVIGEFIGGTQGNDLSLPEIIAERTAGLGIPIMYGLDAGHDTKNLALYLGRKVKLTVDSQNATIAF